MNACFNWYFILDYLSTWGSLGLVADKKYIILWVFKAMFQVVDNPSAAAHAAAGDNNGRPVDIQQLLMVLVFLPLEIKGVVAFGLELLVII
jgi:hypothetical protein